MGWLSPSGAAITGTLEKLKGEAAIVDIKDDGEPVYEGGTEIFWDDAETATDEAGKTIFLDENGAEWTFDQLVKDDEDEEDGQ